MSCNLAELNERFGVPDRIKFFDSSQEGGREGAIVYEGFYVWPNGSHRELAEGGAGLLQDATWIRPDDELAMRQILWYRIRYAQKRLEQATELFESAKKELTAKAHQSSIHGSIPPSVDEVKMVRKLRHEVRKYNSKLEELLEILNPEPEPVTFTKEQAQAMNKNRNEADKILSSLDKIEI